MLTLQRPDPKVSALLGENKGIHHGDVIRPSLFAIPFELGERNVVFNSFTGQCIETDYFSIFEKPEKFEYDENDLEMKDLVASDYLVAVDLDEIKRYTGMLSILRRMEVPKPGYTGYTILPTTACNARCVYCYELGMKYETMSDEIVKQTIRYILATRKKDSSIRFRWFGGEPLLGEAIIDRICRTMRESGVEYQSSMISNGSLMTEELAAKAKKDWNLKNIQITLDGREEIYCDRKRYVAFDGSPYHAVLEGIHAMLKQNIRVRIRLNVDEKNLDELMALVDELETEFENESMISIYCHGIFGETDEEIGYSSDELYSGMEKLDERLNLFNEARRSKGRNDQGSKQNNTDKRRGRRYYDRYGRLKLYFCMVDNPMSGPVILPNGKIDLCEHIGEIPTNATVFDERPIDRESYFKRDRVCEERCRNCGLLPVCTDYNNCPTKNRDCYKETLMAEKRKLRMLEKEKRFPPVNMKIDDRIVRVKEPEEGFLKDNRELIVPFYLKPEKNVSQSEAKVLLRAKNLDGPKRVILHIGMLKTGTTALQSYLQRNKDALAEHGVGFYIQRFLPYKASSNAGFLCWQSLYDAGGSGKYDPERIKEMESFAEFAKGYDTLILSEEFMWEKGIEEPDFWSAVKRNVKQMLGDDTQINVIAFLRRQDEWILSRWKERLLSWFHKEDMDFSDYLDSMERLGHMDYYGALKRIASVFGRENVTVCSYDKKVNDSFDTVKTFLMNTCIEPVHSEKSDTITGNRSISMRAAEAMLFINRNDEESELPRAKLARAARIFSLMYPDKESYYPIDAKERQELLSKYKNINARVSLEYNKGIEIFEKGFEDYTVWHDNPEQASEDAECILKLASLSNETINQLVRQLS